MNWTRTSAEDTEDLDGTRMSAEDTEDLDWTQTSAEDAEIGNHRSTHLTVFERRSVSSIGRDTPQKLAFVCVLMSKSNDTFTFQRF